MKSVIKKGVFFLLTICLLQIGVAQNGISIGHPTPHASAILDIQPPSNNMGLLIPRLSTGARNAISSPAEGLLVYDTDLKQFFFYNGGWYALNEMVRAAGSTSISHTGNVAVNGTVSASNYGLNPNGNGPIPQGGIIMWSGSVASVPTGWALCNGANGTPNLQDRFIVGAGSGYGVGVTGGEATHTLTINEMPSHNHGVTDPGHTHSELKFNQVSDTWKGGGNASNGDGTGNNTSSTTGSSSTGISIQNRGGGQAHENRPPYYALAFIMKL